MDDLTATLPSLDSLFSSARRLRSPFSIVEQGRLVDFDAEKTHVASQLSSRLRGVSSEWVRRGQGQLAVQQLLRVCASEIALAIEQASEPSLHELSSLTMQLSSMQTNVATQLFSLVAGCSQVAAAERLTQREQLRRAEMESSELLDAAELLERQMRLSADERAQAAASNAAREAQLKSHLSVLEQRLRADGSALIPSAPAASCTNGAASSVQWASLPPPPSLMPLPAPTLSPPAAAATADGDGGSPSRAFGLSPLAPPTASSFAATEAGVAISSWASPPLPTASAAASASASHGAQDGATAAAAAAAALPASTAPPIAPPAAAPAAATAAAAAVSAVAPASKLGDSGVGTTTSAGAEPLLPALQDTAELLRSSREALEEAQRMSAQWAARDAAETARVAERMTAWARFGGKGGGGAVDGSSAEEAASEAAQTPRGPAAGGEPRTTPGSASTAAPLSTPADRASAAATTGGRTSASTGERGLGSRLPRDTRSRHASVGGASPAAGGGAQARGGTPLCVSTPGTQNDNGKPARVGSTMPGYLSGGGGGGGRNLSLRQMRELIEDVYASKAKHDAKTAAARLPRETLAQHLSTFLNARYGLKMLIAEYSQACFDAIREYQEVCAAGPTPSHSSILSLAPPSGARAPTAALPAPLNPAACHPACRSTRTSRRLGACFDTRWRRASSRCSGSSSTRSPSC